MANSEILAALASFRDQFESHLTTTNSTLKEFRALVDNRFADLHAAPLPFGSSSAPQQRRRPNAPLQPPGSSNLGDPFLSFDVTSTAASTSVCAASPPFLSSYDLCVKTAGDSVTLDTGVDSSRIASTVLDSTLLCIFTVDGSLMPVELVGKAPSPAPEPTPEVTPPPNTHLRPLPPPSPPTTPSASPTKAAMLPPPATTSPKLSNLIVLAHNTEVGQIWGIILWPSQLDMEAQSNPFNKYQDVAAVASRRGVIFSLYTLEEVYKDSLEPPP